MINLPIFLNTPEGEVPLQGEIKLSSDGVLALYVKPLNPPSSPPTYYPKSRSESLYDEKQKIDKQMEELGIKVELPSSNPNVTIFPLVSSFPLPPKSDG